MLSFVYRAVQWFFFHLFRAVAWLPFLLLGSVWYVIFGERRPEEAPLATPEPQLPFNLLHRTRPRKVKLKRLDPDAICDPMFLDPASDWYEPEVLGGKYIPCPPMIGTPGTYYDRRYKRVWIESETKAWRIEDGGIEAFKYKLDRLNAAEVPSPVFQVLRAMARIDSRPMSKEQRSLYYLCLENEEIRKSGLESARHILRLKKTHPDLFP